MKNKFKLIFGLAAVSVFAVGFGSSLKGGVKEVKADNEVEFEEVAVDVTEAHLTFVATGRYKLLIWFNGERTVDYDFDADTKIDSYTTPPKNPVNTYKYVDGVTYNGVKATPWSGWDNRCDFRRSSATSGAIRQFGFDLSVTPAANDLLVLKQGMEIPSYNYCYNGVEEGQKAKKFVLDKSYVFKVSGSLDLGAPTETYVNTSVDKFSFQVYQSGNPTRIWDAYMYFHLTVNDYPQDSSVTEGTAKKGYNFWQADYTSKIGNSSNVKNASFVSVKDQAGDALTIANDYGQEVFVFKGDNYKGCETIRLLACKNADGSKKYVSEVTIKAGTKFVSYNYLVDTDATIPHSFITTEDVKFVLDEKESTPPDNLRYLTEAEYAAEVAALQTEKKAALATVAEDYSLNKDTAGKLTTGNTAIDAAKTKTAVESAYKVAEADIKSLDDNTAVRKNAKEEIDTVAEDYTLNPEYATTLSTAYGYVNDAETPEDIDDAIADGKDLFTENLDDNATLRQDTKDEIADYLDASKYTRSATELAKIIADANTAIDAADSYAALIAAYNTAKEAMDALVTDVVLDAQDLAVGEIKQLYDDHKAEYVINGPAFEKAYTDGVAAIKAAKTVENVGAAKIAAAEAMGKVETDASVKMFAIADVQDYKGGANAFKLSATAYTAAYSVAEKAINEATAQATIDTAISTFRKAIDALKSDTTIRSSYEASAKAKYDALDKSKYTDENVTAIEALYSKVKSDIAAASSTSALDALIAQFETDLNAIPQKSGGCGSTIGASAIVSLVAISALACFATKKRKFDK